jgi:hypothetical protein
VPQLRLAMRDSTVVAVLGHLDDSSAHALAEAHPRGSATPAFAILLDVDSWRATSPTDDSAGPVWTNESRRVAEILRAAGWWVVPARADEAIPAVWSRLLGQRTASAGPAVQPGARSSTP